MTTPDQRSRAVLETRQFLETLADADEISIAGLVRSVAIGLLRHYPVESDIVASASATPDIWSDAVCGVARPRSAIASNRDGQSAQVIRLELRRR
ncbi:BPSL0761 family protein [Paraburkholderia graminis]|uniref:BPSL0761 family protein n=1 Tax=Paraburkholderia graminis TaxID=60548 RepID=UPI0009DBC46D|nr:BPSL0761 family protein [Paraburkholderia graminis]MDQ0627150.1 hypothetical protein [Paraburkholderia graminis]